MKPKFFIFLLFFLLLISLCFSSATLNTYTNFGSRTILDDYDETIPDDSYDFQQYNLRYDQKISDIVNYSVLSQLAKKNFKTRTTDDNTSLRTQASLDFNGKINSFSLDTKYKTKRFVNKPLDEYNQLKLDGQYTRLIDKNYRLKTTFGINNFDYINNDKKNTFNTKAKLDFLKYFRDEQTNISAQYKIERADKQLQNRTQTKQELKTSFDNKFQSPYIDKLSFDFLYGTRDTKDDEDDIDEDTDYDFKDYMIATKHTLTKNLDTSFKYEYYSKNYNGIDSDYYYNLIYNKIGWDISKTKTTKTWLNFYTEYKKVSYNFHTDNTHDRKHFLLELNHKRKDNYKIYSFLEDNIYRYNDGTKNKDIYKLTVGIEKYISEKITLELIYNYKYTFKSSDNDSRQDSFRLGVNFLF